MTKVYQKGNEKQYRRECSSHMGTFTYYVCSCTEIGGFVEVFKFHFFHIRIAKRTFSHAFGLAESNGTIHFVLGGRETLPQSDWKYPRSVAFRPTAPAATGLGRGGNGRWGGSEGARGACFSFIIGNMNKHISIFRIYHLAFTISWGKTEQMGLC